MIVRDPVAAATQRYDAIVVGGGIHGVALTLEAARRGLATLLVERGDFGSATSWNSLRIVHGGLRYLQTLDLPRFFESIDERRWLFRHFPELSRPLACLMPLYNQGLKRPAVLRAALTANDLLSSYRNKGVVAACHLGGSRVLSASETQRRCPRIAPEGLSGAALWYDGSMPDSQRLLIEMLRWAVACGATALNYVEALSLVRRDDAIAGVVVRDTIGGAEHELTAPIVVNCAGPWAGELASRFDREVPELFRPSIAFNVLLDREPPAEAAVAIPTRGEGSGGTLFLHPFKGLVLAGTQHVGWSGSPDEAHVEQRLVTEMLREINRGLPGFDVTEGDVLRVHWGLLPAAQAGSARLAVRDVIVHHADLGGPRGLIGVSGVKFTTARRVALRALTQVQALRGRSLGPPGGQPRPAPTPWATAGEISAMLESNPAAAAAEARRLTQQEAVIHLDDLLLRRTDWAVDPRQGKAIGEALVAGMGWGPEQARGEAEGLENL